MISDSPSSIQRGIRQTEDIVEKIGVKKAKEEANDADLILYVADSSVPLDENDREILSFIQEKRAIILLNKNRSPDM